MKLHTYCFILPIYFLHMIEDILKTLRRQVWGFISQHSILICSFFIESPNPDPLKGFFICPLSTSEIWKSPHISKIVHVFYLLLYLQHEEKLYNIFFYNLLRILIFSILVSPEIVSKSLCPKFQMLCWGSRSNNVILHFKYNISTFNYILLSKSCKQTSLMEQLFFLSWRVWKFPWLFTMATLTWEQCTHNSEMDSQQLKT